jgi:hypothetical protein
MKVNAKNVIKRINQDEDENKRGRVTLYLNLKTYEAFQKACGDKAASTVIEWLMKDFIESAR